MFRVLHVCTGNICRSPMAELLMREGLRHRLGEGARVFSVESAGTWGHTGSPLEPFAQSTLAGLGVDASAFRARELVAEHVVSADLVLTATREHRAAAVVLHPRAARRTFTVREFDRLLSAVDPTGLPADPEERARALVPLAARQRGLVRADRPEDDDVEDPYGGPAAGYPPTARLIESALLRWLDLVAG
jgi:protein-tyrosine phosphatase